MSDVKILKSIDITSYTIMGTGIGVLFSVLFSIILLIAIGILNAQSIGVVAYIIPTRRISLQLVNKKNESNYF